MRESQGKTSPEENENPEISTQRCKIDILCAINDYIFAKSKKKLFQVRLGKKRKEKVGSDPQAMFIYWLNQKQYSKKKLLLTVMEYFIV